MGGWSRHQRLCDRRDVRAWADILAQDLDERVVERSDQGNLPIYRGICLGGAIAYHLALTWRESPIRRTKAARGDRQIDLLRRFTWAVAIHLSWDGFNEEIPIYADVVDDDREAVFWGFVEAFGSEEDESWRDPLLPEVEALWSKFVAIKTGGESVEYDHGLARWLAAPVRDLPGYVDRTPEPKREPWRVQQFMLAATVTRATIEVGADLVRWGVRYIPRAVDDDDFDDDS